MKRREYVIAMAGLLLCWSCTERYSADVLVIGGTTSGTAAGIAAARMGAKVIVVEDTPMLGGMLTAQGVGATDGNYELHTGIWKEFQDSVFAAYGGPAAVQTGWVSEILFEPHVADRIFKNIMAREQGASVFYGWHVDKVYKKGDVVTGARFESHDGRRMKVDAKVTIDATDTGDALPLSGTEYRVGMDAKSETGEEQAFDSANSIIQDLTLVGILKDYGPDADMTIPMPEGYDPAEFDGYNITSDGRVLEPIDVLWYGRMPGGKYMLNWPGEHGNDIYLEAGDLPYHEREQMLMAARQKTLRFIYYIQTVMGYPNLGIADDEFQTADGLAYFPYFREGRRLKGVVTMTLKDIESRYDNNLYRTGVSIGNYPVDHHHCQCPYIVESPMPKVPSFCVGAGVMIPAVTDGLVVSDKAISVTNLANGSTRLQPVVMATGQAAGTLAALAAKNGCQPREVPVRSLQQSLLDQRCYLQPLFDVDFDDPDFEAIQHIASTGIMKLTGVPFDWANRTYFYPDSIASVEEVSKGLTDMQLSDSALTASPEFQQPLTRRQMAVLLDSLLNPFSIPVDFNGNVTE